MSQHAINKHNITWKVHALYGFNAIVLNKA